MDHAYPSAAMSRKFTDADELAHTLRGASVDYTALHRGAYDARLTVMMLGTLTLHHAYDGAHSSRGATAAGMTTLLLPMGPMTQVTMNGREVSETTAVLIAPGGDLASVCRTAHSWAAITLPAWEFEHILDRWGTDIPGTGGHGHLRLSSGAARRIQSTIAAGVKRAVAMGDALTGSDLAPAFGDTLREMLAALGDGFEQRQAEPDRMNRDAQRLVRRAEDFLAANLDRPIYSDELCRVLGVSQRKLHNDCMAACGMSPQAYLKRRRLGLVRRALMSGDRGAMRVKTVAMMHGFWHLGHFSHDYRDMFGELPTDTLARH